MTVASAADDPFDFDLSRLARARDEVVGRFPEMAGLVEEILRSALDCVKSLSDDYGPWDD